MKLLNIKTNLAIVKRSFGRFYLLFRSLPRIVRLFLIASVAFFCFFIIVDFFFPFPPSAISYSQIINAENGKPLHIFLSDDHKWRMKTELNEIIPELRNTIIEKEDKWFLWHYGINPVSVMRAFWNNIFSGKVTSGASTITMQVARLLEPKERTVGNKLIEMFRAIQLEWNYSKDEILQMYINLVPYGGNIEGMKSASMLFFGCSPAQLSPAQIMTLAIIPNRPTSLALGKNNKRIEHERNKWLEKFRGKGMFSDNAVSDALREPLTASRLPVPRLAPHLALRLRNQIPSEPMIHTTINFSIQQKIQTLSYNYVQRWKLWDINNCAIIVVDNSTHNVIGYIGNPDFSDFAHQGQVDGVKSVRSPGSALKPFVYARAFDAGLLTPKTMIADVATNFDGFVPENFDNNYRGLVTAEDALAFSLNIPAVATMQRLGKASFTDGLMQMGFKQIEKDKHKLGLSLILGGCGVRPEEMAGMFAMFANGGNWAKLCYRKGEDKGTHKRIISKEAAYMVTEILTKPERPDIPDLSMHSIHVPHCAWKTGTSYGRRDAWSVGYTQNYTVCVWLGNFNGVGKPEIKGASVATPLLFEIINLIEHNGKQGWFAKPPHLSYRLVCSETGLPPDTFCEQTVMDSYIPNISSGIMCRHLVQVKIAPDSSLSYCTACLPANGYTQAYYPDIVPELSVFYDSRHIEYKKIPNHNPQCTRIFSGTPPSVLSPTNGATYILEKGDENALLLKAAASADSRVLHWYINDRFVRTVTASEQMFYVPEKEGSLKISCTDDRGRNKDIWVTVQWE